MRLDLRIIIFFLVCLACFQNVSGFGMEYHGTLIQKSLYDEGFDENAINLVQSEQFLNDMGSKATEEYWVWYVWQHDEVRDDADRMHFDNKCNYTELKNEWDRLEYSTYAAVKQSETEKDVPGFLAVLGISLHTVQDFYAHSNWAPRSTYNRPIDATLFGSIDATWFDIPDSQKSQADLYTHCYKRQILHDKLNKDYAGRPNFDAAYREAYYATEQWVDLVHSWVSEDFWQRTKKYKDADFAAPDFYNNFAYPSSSQTWDNIRHVSWYSGSWNGPYSFSKPDLIRRNLLRDQIPSEYFDLYANYIKIVANPTPPITDHPHNYSAIPQQKWLKIETTRVTQTDCAYWDIDPGGEADFYLIITVNDPYRYFEAPKQNTDDFKPDIQHNWVTLAPLPIDENNVRIEYQLWDDDDGYSSDDLCDIDWPYNSNSWKYVGSLEGVKDLSVITNGRRGFYQCGSCAVYCWCCGTQGDGDEASAEFHISVSEPPYLSINNIPVSSFRAQPSPDNPSLSLSANPSTVILPGSVTFQGSLSGYHNQFNQKVQLKRGHYTPTIGLTDSGYKITLAWVDDELIATVYTDLYGKFSFTHKIAGDTPNTLANTSYIAYAESQDSKLIATSNIVDIEVRQSPISGGSTSDLCTNKCTSLVCDDQNPYTIDSCDPCKGCIFTPVQIIPIDNSPCDDGNLCTVNDHYLNGACIGGQAQNGDDGNPNTVDTCNPATGCVFTSVQRNPTDNTPCDDGNLCTVNDYYLNGVCIGGQTQICDDGIPNTIDSCDPVQGCVHSLVPSEQTCPEPCRCMYESEARQQYGGFTRCSDTPCYTDYPMITALQMKYCIKPLLLK